MKKSATRLLELTIYAAALVVVPMIAPAKAATNGREEEKAQRYFKGALVTPIPGQSAKPGLLRGLTVRLSAPAPPEASIARSGPLRLMRILTERPEVPAACERMLDLRGNSSTFLVA